MKFSYSFRVPFRERIKLLFLGGLNIELDYTGQHKISRARLTVMDKKDVTGYTK